MSSSISFVLNLLVSLWNGCVSNVILAIPIFFLLFQLISAVYNRLRNLLR